MKTSKITATFATLNFVLFMSVSSTAIPFNTNSGDNVNGITKQTGVAKSNFREITSTEVSGNEYKYLLFDVTQSDTESGIAELPVNSLERLRFDVNKFSDVTDTEISELPVMNEFDYLRFDVNEFVGTDLMTAMPVNEFDYLRFDVNEFIGTNLMTAMPENEFDYLRFDADKYLNETIPVIDELPVNSTI